MKLLDLHLLAYGPFTDQHLDLSAGTEGLHLVFGPNEAGKSSALRALRALLYGVPERTQDDFRHGKTEMRVGGLVRGADGTELRCYRRKGRKNTLLDEKGDPITDHELARLLGGVAEPLFERLFGIDHEALVSGGQALLDEHGREAEALFGTGLGSTAVHALLETLDEEAQALFAPRASKPLINAALSRLSELDRRQREVTLPARTWDEARKAVETATGRLSQVAAELADAERRHSTLNRIRHSLPDLARREQIRERLAGLGDVPVLEDDFGQRREESLSSRRLAAQSRSKAKVRLEGLRKDATGLEVSEDLLAQADTIDELRDRLGGYHKAANDRPGLIERRATRVEQARQRFAEIRPDLSIDDIERLRPMLARRRRATELGGRREALESAVQRAREDRERAAGKLEKRRGELSNLPPPVSYEELQRAVDEARRTGDLDSAIDGANAELIRHEVACQRDLESLGLWTGTLADLLRAPLPAEVTLQRFTEVFHAIKEEKNRFEASISETIEERRRTEQSLRALTLAGDVPTEAELRNARDRRDHGWRLLKRQWIDGEDVTAESRPYTDGRPLPVVFEAGITGADEIADRLRRESQRVHEQAAARAKLEACGKLTTDTERELEAIAERRSALEQSWEDAWKATGISPSSPREMSAWVGKASLLRDKAGRGDELRAKADTLRRSRETQLRNLRAALATCGQAQPRAVEQSELRPLLDHAESCLASLERIASSRAALEEAIAELDDS